MSDNAVNTPIEKEEHIEKFLVLINHEEQYSLWPSYKAIPAGWSKVFGEDIKEMCLEYVEEHWTDMRPLSLRKQMEEIEKQRESVVIDA